MLRKIGSGLGPTGRQFVRKMVRDHEGWTAVDVQVLRLAGRSVDRIDELDEAIGSAVVVTGPRGATTANPLLGVQRAETRQLLQLIKQLGLEGA